MGDTDPGMTEVKTRRNGQLSSCENCRKSKQRCDHGMPHCMRCQKRGQAAQCHYHPAPMTRGPRTSAAGIVKITSTSSRNRDLHQSRTNTPRNNIQQAALDRGTSLVSMGDVLSPLIESAVNERDTFQTYTALTRTGIATAPFAPSPALIEEGESILEILRDSPKALGDYVSSWYESFGNRYPCGPLVRICWTVVHEVLVQSLKDEPNHVNLSLQSRSMFSKTAQQQRWPHSPANGALERAITTDGFRWDTVGVYFALVGNALGDSAKAIDFTHEKWGPSLKAAKERVLQASIQCYTFCERVGQVNDLTVALLINTTLLATWCYGDDSYQAWRLMGDLASLIGAIGFHRDTHDGQTVPTYLQELRKRDMELCHEIDKGLATFVGRPPRLYRRHYDLGAPLDLPEEVFFGTTADIESAIKELDAEGWNTKGLVYPASRLRVQHKLVTLREEALELAMSYNAEDISLQSQQLLRKSAALWESFPPHLRYNPSCWNTTSPHGVGLLVYLRLENLYTEFLLQKLIVNQDHTCRGALIQISHQILSLVLSVLNKRPVVYVSKVDFEWTLVNYAMPCASILILELLRQSEHPEQPVNINRSKLIQEISVLISCDWMIEPDQMNFGLCKRAQSLFSRSLDRILNHVPTRPVPFAAVPPSQAIDTGAANGLTPDSQLAPIDDAEWLAWLETCDLSVDPWLDILADNTQGTSGYLQTDSSQYV